MAYEIAKMTVVVNSEDYVSLVCNARSAQSNFRDKMDAEKEVARLKDELEKRTRKAYELTQEERDAIKKLREYADGVMNPDSVIKREDIANVMRFAAEAISAKEGR